MQFTRRASGDSDILWPSATTSASGGILNNPHTTVDEAVPSVIPPPIDRARTLVLCFDGTGDQFDADVGTLLHNLRGLYSNPRVFRLTSHRTRMSSNSSRC